MGPATTHAAPHPSPHIFPFSRDRWYDQAGWDHAVMSPPSCLPASPFIGGDSRLNEGGVRPSISTLYYLPTPCSLAWPHLRPVLFETRRPPADCLHLHLHLIPL